MANLERIGVDVRSKLQIDADTGQLYWDGQRVITDMMIDLPTWVDIAVGAAAIVMVLQYLGLKPRRWPWVKGKPIDRQTSSRDASGGCSGTQTHQDISEGDDG